jgi:hypothetical protein
MRAVVIVLLLAASSLAQAKPDFSGVFLRTETAVRKHPAPAVPRVLVIKETIDEVVVTAVQNGETAVVHYRLDGKESDTVKARLKGANLVLRTTVERKWPASGFSVPTALENLEEKWTLSPDSQQLVICTKADIGVSECETYIREPSFETAKAAAESADGMDCKNSLPISESGNEKKTTRGYDQGAVLGTALFEQITRCVAYEAVLSGDFFKGLERTKKSGQTEFHRKGKVISAYADDIILEVSPSSLACRAGFGSWVQDGALPEQVHDLRFMVRWHGAQEKDFGEVESEVLHEPWREQQVSSDFYRMRIPAKGIPLSDDLEVVIFAKDGKQLGCVKGHI